MGGSKKGEVPSTSKDSEKKFHVLVAVDKSDQAQGALEYYLDFLHRPNHYVTVLHCPVTDDVFKRMDRGEVVSYAEDYWKIQLQLEKQRWTEFGDLCMELIKESNAEGKFVIEQTPEPGPIICRTAKKLNAKLIVMGTRGMGTVRRTILGSISDFVLHHAPCAVNIFRTSDFMKQQEFEMRHRSSSLSNMLGKIYMGSKSRSSSNASSTFDDVQRSRANSYRIEEPVSATDGIETRPARSSSFALRELAMKQASSSSIGSSESRSRSGSLKKITRDLVATKL